MMSIMSTLTPLATKFSSEVIKALVTFISNIWKWLSRKFGPKINKITIKQTTVMTKRGWISEPGDYNNGILLESMLEFLSYNKIYPEELRLQLGAGKECLDGNEYAKSRTFQFIPTKTVKYNDFLITYTETTVQAQSNDNIGEKVTKTISISSHKSTQEINEFIHTCHNDHVDRHLDKIDGCYLYKQIRAEKGLRFKRYLVTNRTKFEDIYLPEKDKILDLVKKFQSGDLKKLSYLFYGKPGCGKTSLIKALANYLGYSIIEVKLSFMRDDSSLNDMFHNRALIYHKNNDETFSIMTDIVPLEKRIYIFEDIDAECDEIHQRSEKHELKEVMKTDTFKEMLKDSSLLKKIDNNITLAGVLNALDGVLEISGVLVMTTNHVDKLDEALTRPGRITYRVELKKMLASEANKMIYNKFGKTLDDLHDYTFTPATLEAACSSANSIQELHDFIMKMQEYN